MSRWEEVWSFETQNFRVVCAVTPCDDDPSGSFSEQEDVDAVRSGDVAWFDVRVSVHAGRCMIGTDYLGCCAYSTAEDFVTSHRDTNPMNRNCSVMRAARGERAVVCHYFPDMVRQAIAQAREHAAAQSKVLASVSQ